MTGQSFVQIAADSTGKKLDTWIVLGSGGAEVHREAFILTFPDALIGSATATSVGGNTMLHVAPLMSAGVFAQQAGTWNIGTLTAITSSVGVSATQAGTWTVQQGGAPWSVTFPSAQQVTFTNSVGTHPVTIEGQPISVSQSGTWNINALTSITSSVGVSATIVGQPVQTFLSDNLANNVAVLTQDPIFTSRGLVVRPYPGANVQSVGIAFSNVTLGVTQSTTPWVVSVGRVLNVPNILLDATDQSISLTRIGAARVHPISSSGGLLEFSMIDIGGQNDNTIVAADSTNRIKVVSFALTCERTTQIMWKSGAGAAGAHISGPMRFAGSGGISFSGTYPSVAFQTAINTALVVSVGSAVSVGGHLSFYREP